MMTEKKNILNICLYRRLVQVVFD